MNAALAKPLKAERPFGMGYEREAISCMFSPQTVAVMGATNAKNVDG